MPVQALVGNARQAVPNLHTNHRHAANPLVGAPDGPDHSPFEHPKARSHYRGSRAVIHDGTAKLGHNELARVRRNAAAFERTSIELLERWWRACLPKVTDEEVGRRHEGGTTGALARWRSQHTGPGGRPRSSLRSWWNGAIVGRHARAPEQGRG